MQITIFPSIDIIGLPDAQDKNIRDNQNVLSGVLLAVVFYEAEISFNLTLKLFFNRG
jgi:hypothetical protein